MGRNRELNAQRRVEQGLAEMVGLVRGVIADGKVSGEEAQRLSGSCPMIYTWNGEEFEFITDVLGVAPLGAAAGDGKTFPVDHDEHIQIAAESLQPRDDGQYEILIVEELLPFIEEAVHVLCSRHGLNKEILGKHTGHFERQFEYLPEIVQQGIHDALGIVPAPPESGPVIETPVRPPVLCSSCPHRGAFFGARAALGDPAAKLGSS